MGNVPVPVFASASEALDMVHAGLRFLADGDATELTAEEQAGCLRSLERVASVTTAARSSVLGAFTAGQGYSADADYSPRAWLIHRTGITRGAAVSYTAWAKRAVAHPRVFEVLAAGDISESFARTICLWTDKLPAASRDAADGILMGAAVSGLALRDLAVLTSEMLARSWQPDKQEPPQETAPDDQGDRPEEGPGDQPGGDGTGDDPHEQPGDGGDGQPDGGGSPDGVFEDRALKLLVTFQGAGVLHGDLTPECAEIVNTVLDALAAPAGPEDTRDQGQRYHDALQEAMTRLIASGLLPERGGQPVKAWVNISLADLMLLDGSSALLGEWTAGLRARFAAHRAASAGGGGDSGGAWLDGDAAEAITCDAVLAPVVTGDVDPGAFDDLVRLCVELDRLRHGADRAGQGPAGSGDPADGSPDLAVPAASGGASRPSRARPCPGRRWSRPSSARPPPCSRVRVAWRRSCAEAARRAARRAEPAAGHRLQQTPSPPQSVTRSSSATCTASGPDGCRPARRRLRSPPHQTQGQRRQDQPQDCVLLAGSITRSSSTAGAGPWSSTRTAPRPPGTRTRPWSSTATAHQPAPGNRPGRAPRSSANPGSA